MQTLLTTLRNRARIPVLVVSLGSLIATSGPIAGADFYWDADTTSAGNNVDGTNLGGTGTWNNLLLNWWDLTNDVVWPNNDTANGIFTYAYPITGVPTSNTVTLTGGLTANKLSFLRSGYTLTGGTSLTLDGTGAGLHANLGESATIASLIDGADGLVKTGGGSIRLTNALNSYSGAVSIAGGTIIINSAAALGGTGTVSVTSGNGTPSNALVLGFTGGSLLLDGSAGGFTFSRNLNLEGRGPIGQNGAALLSIGNNTVSGTVATAVSSLTPATFRNTRITSANGTLNLSGTLNVLGTAGTTITTLGGGNQAGVGNYNLTGVLSGTGTLEKSGGGTLFLSPSDTSGFAGRLRISGSSAVGQSSVRVTAVNAFGTANSGTTSAPIDMNGGVLEILSDSSLNFGKNVYGRTTSTFFVNNSIGGISQNGTATFGNLSYEDNITLTFNSRNGYGMAFTTAPVNGGDNNSTFTNNMGGTLSFTGNFWSNADNAAARTLAIGGNGNTAINGNIIAASAAFDHVLTKSGAGSLTVTGTGTTLDGNVNVQAGAIQVTDFRSLNMHSGGTSTGSLVLGNTTTTGGNLIIGTGTAATVAGLTMVRPITLNTTSANNSIYANQTGSNPVILNGAITKIATATTGSLILGGTNAADNIVNVVIPVEATPSTGGVIKLGAGTWVLNAANTYRGATTIQNGTLKLRATAAASDVIGELASNTIVFSGNTTTGTAGGTLEFTGFSGASTTETLGALTPTAGASTIRLVGNGVSAANLTFTSLGATAAASSLNFDTTGANGGVITLTGQAATTATNLPGTANFLGHLYLNGADFATINGSAQVVAPTYAGAGNFQNAAGALVAAVHNKLTGSFTQAGATTTISSLLTNSQTLTLGGNLVVSTGGILQSGGTSSILSDSGTARLIQGGVAATNVAIRVDSSSDVLNIGSAANPVNISSTTTGGLTKNGAGKLVFFGTNAQTGTVNINEGKIELNGTNARLAAAAGVATVVRQNAFLDFNTSVAFAANPTVSTLDGAGTIRNIGSADVTFVQTAAGTWAGSFNQTGSGVLSVSKLGTTGAPVWQGISNYTGVTTIGGTTGSVTVDFLANIGEDSGIGRGLATNDATNAASLVFSATGATPGGLIYRGDIIEGALTLGSRSATTNRLFTLAGSGVTLGSTQTTNLNNSIVWSNTGAIVHAVTGPQAVTFTGTSQGDNMFIPQLTDSGVGLNITSVTKTGTGIWHLGAANNTYSGATLIQQGILGATNGAGLSSNSNLQFDGGTIYSQGTFTRNIGTGAGQMQFLAPAANTAQFSGGFLGGDSKLTVNWAGTPVWGGGAGFLDTRDGLMLNGSQARAQGATGSIALSEVEIAGNFSLGTANGAAKAGTLSVTTATNSANVTVTAGDTSGLIVGQSLTGPNFASGAYIVSINSATTFTMSANGAVAGTGVAGHGVEANNLRAIRVDDNGNTGADFATISGIISAGDAATGIRKLGTGTLKLTGANTYTGETNINQGFLSVLSLGQSGSSGATSVGNQLNANLNASAITLGNGGTGGASLQYLGAGEVSDRKIRLNSTTGSTQIHADGAGALILTNVANDMVAGAKTFFLRGTNNAGNMITSQLSDNGGPLSVTIDANATWILTNAANNYSGTTTVSSGALGIGHDTAIGGAILNSNGNIFAYGGDRTVSNTMTLNNNANWGFLGDYNLTFSNAVLGSTANSNILINSIVAGKALTFTGLIANGLTGTRNFTVDGPGETIINGNFTTSTAFGVQIIKTGDGTLTLGGDGTVSNWNQVGTGIDVDRGTLKFITNNAINTTAGYAGMTLSPDLADTDTATVDFNGTTQTVNALTATSNGTLILDNTSSSAATFRFGANNSTVNFGSGVGTYSVQNTGSGALSLVKLGNTTTTFNSGITLAHEGITASEGGGVFNIASAVTATTGLRAIEASTLSLSGGLPNGDLVTSIEVGGGSILSLLDGVGSQFENLDTLSLGNTGTGTVTLNLNVGDLTVVGDGLQTDTLTLVTTGTLNLGNTITFNLTDAGLNANTTYTLVNVVDGGLITGPLVAGNWIQGATPGGFDSFTWFVDDNVVQLTTGNLIVGDLYWRGVTNTTWNGNANNWSTDKAGTTPGASIPGQGTKVIFAYNGVGTGALTTTLEQNFKINALVFEAGTTTPSSVTINPGALTPSARLEIAPTLPADGITISTGGPASVEIASNLKIGANQTWNITGASTLTLSGVLSGEADVTKSGAGKVIVTGAADPTFNAGQTTDFTVSAGTLEFTNLAAFGTLANSNLANFNLTGGAFYYNNAASGTIVNALTLNGGTLSAGRAAGGAAVTSTYSSTVNVSGNSFINLRDVNSAAVTTVANNITLSGVVSGTGSLRVSSDETVANLVGGNAEIGTFTINNAASSWTGDLILDSGTVDITAAASATVLPGDVTFDGFGRLIVRGLNGQTITRTSDTLTFTGNTIGEYLLDNTSGVLAADFVVNQNGQVNIGAGGTGASARFTVNDAATQLNIGGAVILGGNSSISVDGGDADSFVTISGIISDGGSGYTLAINDDAGGWGASNDILRFTGANTFSGNLSLAEGVLEFTTVTNAGGAASSLGQGTAISMTGGTLRFVGSSAQSTNRTITSATGAITLSANGATASDTITYTGAITIGPTGDGSQLVLTGAAGREGIITGGITQTLDTADITVNGGTWTLSGAASTVADDLVVTGTSTILNLNSAGVVNFGASAGNLLQITNGGTVNLGASGSMTGMADTGIYLAQSAGGAEAVLNMNTFNQTTLRLILGDRLADRSGRIDGTGTLTVDGGTGIELYRGTINANLASTAATPFNKFGPGTVTLKGDNSGILTTTAAIINEGTLVLDYTANNATKLREASQLSMLGANLSLIGNNSAATSQTVASFTLGSGGNNVISLTPGTLQTVVLNLNAITRAVNAQDGTVRFILPTGTQSATNGITTDTLNTIGTGTDAILGGWATVNDGTGVFFARNVPNTVDGNIGAAVTTSTDAVGSWLTGKNISDTTGFSGTYANVYLNSLRFNAAGGSDVNLGATGVLGIASGGILVTENVAGTPSILGGTIFSGAQVSNVPELIITHDGSTIFELGADLRTNSALTKSGSGTVLLSGDNVYTGFTEIQNGTLQLSGGDAIGDTSTVTFSTSRNSTLELLDDETIGRLAGGRRNDNSDYGTVAIGSNTLTLNVTTDVNYDGFLTGAGTIIKGGANFQGFRNISSGFTGDIVINQGGIQFSGVGRIDASSFTINKGGAMDIANTGTTSSTTRILNTTPIVLNSADGAMTGTGGAPRLGLHVRNDQNNDRTETIGNLVFNSGASYLSGDANVGTGNARAGIAALDFVRANSATVAVRARNLGTTTTNNIQFRISDATNQTAFISALTGGAGAAGTVTLSIVPWALGETHNNAALAITNMGNSLVTYVSVAGFRPLDFSTEYATYGTSGVTNNTRESLGADLTGLTGRTLNSLVIDNLAFAGLDVTGSGAGQTLTNTSGAFLFTVTGGVDSTAYDTTLGGFDDGIAVGATNEYVFFVVNPSSAATTPTLTATIASELTSGADITKSGRGTLILNQANTAGGGSRKTTINEGILEIADLDNIGGGTGSLVFAGGTLRLGVGFADDLSSRTISLLLGGGTLDTNGINLALAGSLGSGAGSFTKTGAGNLTLNAAATMTGNTVLSAGTITIGANNALGVGGNLSLGAGTTLALGSNSISHGLVTTSGASPLITGNGTITASTGFFFNHTGDTSITAILAGAGGLLKAQANILTLTGASTYTGTTEIQAGTLSINSISNVGAGASALGNPGNAEDGVIRMGLTTAATSLNYTGSGHSSNRLIGMQGTTGGVTLDADGTGALGLGGARFENAGNKTLTLRGDSAVGLINTIGAIQEIGGVLTLNKSDANTWMVNGVSSYTGATQIDSGILMVGVDNALSTTTAVRIGTGTTAGTLDLNGFNQTIGSLTVASTSDLVTNNIIVDTGKTLTINGAVTVGPDADAANTNLTGSGGGSIVVNSGGANFIVGAASGATNDSRVDVDFTGLTNFTANLGAGIFRLGDVNSGTENNPSTMKLAVNNTITASAIRVGDGAGGGVPTTHTLTLGSGTNTLNADTINIGSAGATIRSGGAVVFDALDTTGQVTVRASDGTGRATINMINTTGNTGGSMESTLDLVGHTANILASTVTMATRSLGSGAATATLSFDQGTLDITTLNMANRTGAGTGGATATVNLGDSAALGTPTVTIGAINMAVNTSSGGAVAADLNVTGGNVTIGTGSGTAINMANAGTGRTVTSTIDLTGGNVSVTGDIIRTGGAGTENATVTLNGATLDMNGNDIGTLAQNVTFVAQSGTLTGLAELNGGGALSKTTAGTLTLTDDNTYTGGTTVGGGILLANNTTGSATGTGAVTVQNGGTVSGFGSISGNTTIESGGTVSAGFDGGSDRTLNFGGDLTAQSGSIWLVDLVEDANGVTDHINVSGNLTISGAIFTVGSFANAHTMNNSYVIATYGGNLTGEFDFGGAWLNNTERTLDGGQYLINYGGGSNSFITLTAVPEPGTFGLLGLALAGLAFLRFRKRRQEAVAAVDGAGE